MVLYWNLLRDHDLKDLSAAMAAHMRDPKAGKFMPKPAEIIAKLPGQQAPGADAAWDVALKSRPWEEEATCILPSAVFHSFPFHVWASGDPVAARMAFKDAYPAMVEKYGDEVEVSLGHSAVDREPAIMDAYRAGLITSFQAKVALPHMADEIESLAGPAPTLELAQPRKGK